MGEGGPVDKMGTPFPVIRIHLILMQIRILILDPHCKKMDPDQNPDPIPGHFLNIYLIF